MKTGRTTFLSEDYLVVAVTRFATPMSADALIAEHAEEIARLVRGERQPLSRQEREDICGTGCRTSPTTWSCPRGTPRSSTTPRPALQAALEILEFANSQLLEFRYYDDLLDVELTRIYATLQEPRWFEFLTRPPATSRAARHLHALFIDVNELTDRTENALKFVGDIYAARLFALVAARLGLDALEGERRRRSSKTLDDIYRFAVEQLAISRGHFLELTVVVILLIELVLFFLGIMT